MSANLAGQQLGRYLLLEEIGRGGMAVVYRARHPTLERLVAVKVLASHLIGDEEFVIRFQREANAAAQFKHPNIVMVHDIDEASGHHFIVMEYLGAPSLEEIIRQEGPLPPARAAHIVTQVAAALDYAHARGLVHRDVKPSNILVDAQGHATLTDFGLAHSLQGTRLTKTGIVVGTPAYMAPEQVNGEPVSAATDVYALGVVTYEMLTGHVPFEGDTPVATLMAHVNKTPPPLRRLKPDVPTQVETVVLKALKKAPQKRYGTAGEFATALQGASSEARPAPSPEDTTPLAAPRTAAGESPGGRRVTVSVIAPVLVGVLTLIGIVALTTLVKTTVDDPRIKAARHVAALEKTSAAAQAIAEQGAMAHGTVDAYATAAAEAAVAATQTAYAVDAAQTTYVAATASAMALKIQAREADDARRTAEAKPASTLPAPPPQPPAGVSIALLEPNQGKVVTGCVNFKWRFAGRQPEPGPEYELFICRAEALGQACPLDRASKTTHETAVALDPDKPEEVDINPRLKGQTNVFFWKVAVRDSPRLSSLLRTFVWNGGDCGEDAGVEKPTPASGTIVP